MRAIEVVELDRGTRSDATAVGASRAAGLARGRLGQRVSEVQRGEHRDALARLDLAAVADRAHLAVDLGHGLQQRLSRRLRGSRARSSGP